MTVTQLMTNAIAMMGGDLQDMSDYEPYALASVNTMLADLFEINNALLTVAGEDLPAAIPEVDAAESELAYDARLQRNVMVFGMARDFARKDNNPAMGYYTRMYDEKKQRYNVGVAEPIADHYADQDGE